MIVSSAIGISPRVLYVTTNPRKHSLKIIQVYAPTSTYSEQEIEEHYEHIETTSNQ